MTLPTLRLSSLRSFSGWSEVSRGLAQKLRGKVIVLPGTLGEIEVGDTVDSLALLLGWPVAAVARGNVLADRTSKDEILLVAAPVAEAPNRVPGAVVVCQEEYWPRLSGNASTMLGLPGESLVLRDAVIECLGRQLQSSILRPVVSWVADVADTPGTAMQFVEGAYTHSLLYSDANEADLYCAGLAAVGGYLLRAVRAPIVAQWMALIASGATVPEKLVRGEATELSRIGALRLAFWGGLVHQYSEREEELILRRPLEAMLHLENAPIRLSRQRVVRQLMAQVPAATEVLEQLLAVAPRGLGQGGPPASEHLVGRRDDLARMGEMLQVNPTAAHPPMLVLTGHGGVGKTELAAAFSGLHVEELEPLWIDFGVGAENGWYPVARALGIEVNTAEANRTDEQGVPAWIRHVHDRVRSGPYLIVVEGSDEREEDKLPGWLPDGPSSGVILLLRRKWSWKLQNERDALYLSVSPLTLEAARQLLALRAPHLRGRISSGVADSLIYQIGGYPLALMLVAEALKQQDISQVQESLHGLRTQLNIPENTSEGVWLAVSLVLQGLSENEIDALAALSLQVGRSLRLAQALVGAETLESLARRSLLTLQPPWIRLHDLVGTYARWQAQSPKERYERISMHYAQQVLLSMRAAIRDEDGAEQERLSGELVRAMVSLLHAGHDNQMVKACGLELADLLADYQGGIRAENLRWASFGYSMMRTEPERPDQKARLNKVEAELKALTGKKDAAE